MTTLNEAIRAKLEANAAEASARPRVDHDAAGSAQKDRMVAAMKSDPDWFDTLPQRQQSEIKGWASFRARQAARKEGKSNE